MIRIATQMTRFIKTSKAKTKKSEIITSDERTTLITTNMIQNARILLIKLMLQQKFKEECKLEATYLNWIHFLAEMKVVSNRAT